MDQVQTKKKIKRPPLEGLYPYLVFILLGFFVADLALIPLRGHMMPTQAPPSKPKKSRSEELVARSTLTPITARNIFSRDGLIPAPLAQKAKPGQEEQAAPKDAAPVPSSLPLSLIGTIVHSNPEKSIANIEVRPKSTVIAVRVNKDIDTLATLLSVERGKVIIRNLNNQRLEYLEIKSLNKLSFNAPKASTGASGKQEVKQTGQNKFEINRADVLKYTSDMSSVLQQAAMQPRRKANGEIDGFKFLNIQPGSIYTQLGFQVGDVIKSVNGEPVDSPAKAMEMYNTLKGANSIKILIERDGREQENDYTIK